MSVVAPQMTARGSALVTTVVAAAVIAAYASAAQAGRAPVEGPAPARAPVAAPVLRPFDPPDTPYGAGHRGVDLEADEGSRIHAVLDGVVTFSGVVVDGGWVTVDHGDGLVTTYGRLDPRFVERGARVRAGEALGELQRGRAHVDWGARLHGSYVDPLGLLAGGWQVHLVDPSAPLPSLPQHPIAPAGRLRWPVAGALTSRFGPRRHPVTGQTRMHAGIDIAAASGTPVVAAGDGVVRSAGRAGGYGLLVVVDHGGGISTRSAHLSRVSVRPGQTVRAGAVIGEVGSTGLSTGPHLHFEVRLREVAQDPLRWVSAP